MTDREFRERFPTVVKRIPKHGLQECVELIPRGGRLSLLPSVITVFKKMGDKDPENSARKLLYLPGIREPSIIMDDGRKKT